MSTPDPEPMVHPQALLLPWYDSDTLSPQDRARVEAHLRACAECRSELDAQRALRASIRAATARVGDAPAAALGRVMAQVVADAPPPLGTPPARALRSLSERIASACRALLAPKWAPAAALVLIMLQLGLLLRVSEAPSPPPVTTRALRQAAPQVRVLFNPGASLAAANEALRTLGGRIVDGPGPDGAYVVELAPGGDPVARRLSAFRARADVVARVEASP